MMPPLFSSQLAVLGLLWRGILLHPVWPNRGAVSPQRPGDPAPITPQRQRAHKPKPFVGLTHKPPCALCEHEATHGTPPSPRRPDPRPPTHRRPRGSETSKHFCPHSGCRYRGWLGVGNLRANGHPSGGSWRQFQCTACNGYFPEHPGTLFYGKRVPVELSVQVLACWAEGLGMRATARVFAVAPNTVLGGWLEAAEQRKACSASLLCDGHGRPCQLDALYAVLRDGKNGESSAAEALKRLERSRPWVWTVIDPASHRLLATASGPRTLAMAQRVVHQGVQG
jgi:hypothetical protein